MTWQTAKLGEVCDVRDGTHDSPKYTETGFPLITSKNLVNGYIDTSNASYISEADYIDISKRSKVDCGDILMPMIGTIGNPVVVDEPSPEFAIKNVALIKFTDTSPDRSFIKSVLQSQLFSTYVDNASRGGTQKFLSLGDIRKFSIPLPPLPEQKRIAAILDKADELKRKREAAIAKLDQFAQSISVEMFGDLINNDKGWQLITIGEALKQGLITGIQDGNHGESHPKSSDFVETGIPFIMANCMIDGKIDFEKAYKLDESWLKKLRIGFAKPDDVLLSHKGTVGEVAIVPSIYKSIILSPQTTYYRTSPRLNSNYLAGFFKSSWFQSIIKKDAIQSTRAYIGITRQRELPFFLPPLALQEEFANRISKLDKLKADSVAALAKQNNLFASLQHQAFSGQL